MTTSAAARRAPSSHRFADFTSIFQGAPNTNVSIYSDNPDGGRYVFAYRSVFSPSTPTATDSTGTEWFCWEYQITVPVDAWWRLSTGAYFARLGAADDYSGTYWSYDNPPSQCPLPFGMEQLDDLAPCALRPPTGGKWRNSTTTYVFASQ